jgi:TIR domain
MSHIFLSYAREDKEIVEKLYLNLREARLPAWMDKPPPPYDLDGIRPGEKWDIIIREKMRDASHVLVFLSKASVLKRGFVQREYQLALIHAMEQPPDAPYLIPVLLDDCNPPKHRVDHLSLDQFDWFPLYVKGPDKLVEYLRIIANVQAEHDALASKEVSDEPNEKEALVEVGGEDNQGAVEADSSIDPFSDQPKSSDPTIIGLRNRVRLLTAQLAQSQSQNAFLGTQLHLLKHQLRECTEKISVTELI